jgi:hypothetical protein
VRKARRHAANMNMDGPQPYAGDRDGSHQEAPANTADGADSTAATSQNDEWGLFGQVLGWSAAIGLGVWGIYALALWLWSAYLALHWFWQFGVLGLIVVGIFSAVAIAVEEGWFAP